MSFGHPLLLLTLLLVPAAVLALRLAERRRMRYAVEYTNLDVLAAVAVAGGRPWRRYLPAGLALLALATLCVAFARPHATSLVPKERATVILVLDVSGSMQANDVRPTRLAAAQKAVRGFLDRVPPQLRVGLVAFSGDAQVAAPPTTDHALLRRSLDSISSFTAFGGTAIGDALEVAVELAEQAGSSRPYKPIAMTPVTPSLGNPKPADTKGLASILFLSDGHQTRGTLQPLQGAQRAKIAKIRVYTVSLGTPQGVLGREFGGFHPIPVPPDPATLAAIAQTTGGTFFDAQSAGALRSAYSKLGSSLGRVPGKSEVTYAFLAGAAGLLVAAGFLSALWSPRLP